MKIRNTFLHRRITFLIRNVLRIIHAVFVFLDWRKFDRWLLPHAACVLIEDKEGKVLAVSRKDDSTKFGLPGGKTDSGETDEQAAIRELYEETGIKISFINLRKIFESTDDFEYWTTCYYACLLYTPQIDKKSIKEKGEVQWVDRKILTSGIFGKFNTRLFETLDQIKSEQCLFCGAYHG